MSLCRARVLNISAVSFAFFLVTFSACKPRHEQVAEIQQATQFGRGQSEDLTTYKIPDEPTATAIWEQMASPEYNMNPRYVMDTLVKPLMRTASPAQRRDLSESEAVALYYYTANYYEFFNKALRHSWDSDRRNASELNKWHQIILAVASGINKQPSRPCEVQRGTSLRPQVFDTIQRGGTFSDPGFMSTTEGEIPAEFKKGVTFKISAQHCHSISWISRFPAEKEVLFTPGTTFKVTSKTGTLERANVVIAMEEIDSPQPAAAEKALPSRDSKGGSKGRQHGQTVAVTDFYGKKYLFQPSPTEYAENRFIQFKGTGAGDGYKEALVSFTTGERPARWKLAGDHLMTVQYQAGNRNMRLWFYIIDKNHLGRVTKASLLDSVDEQALNDADLSDEDVNTSELDIMQYYTVK